MKSASTWDTLRRQVGQLFICSEWGDRERVQTPFLYPDGEVIELFCERQEDHLKISDLGETTRWLAMQTASDRRTSRQMALIRDICMTHGVTFERGALVAQCREADAPWTLIRVAQAASCVSDLWFTFRRKLLKQQVDPFSGSPPMRSEHAVTTDFSRVSRIVKEYLWQRGLSFQRETEWEGQSRIRWKVHFSVVAAGRQWLIYVLHAENSADAERKVRDVMLMWYDLQHLAQKSIRFVSIFDGSPDVWSASHFAWLETLSVIVRWPELDQLGRLFSSNAAGEVNGRQGG
ncbi:MAG: hypothetical protein KatS3mg110_2617 [Pirellulaceae bacterium]|nr:MAG: hypothetical protein KatS3mg110_2617 [Pirellulaceae bacterium]